MTTTKTINGNIVVLNYKQFESIFVIDSMSINAKPVNIQNCGWNNFSFSYNSNNRINRQESRIVKQILRVECNKINKISIVLNVTNDSNYQWAFHINGNQVSKQIFKYGSWSGKKKDGQFVPITGSRYISIDKAKEIGWDMKTIWNNGKIATNA